MSAASPPAEVLLVIFEHLFLTKDLLRAALVNRAWRAACTSLKTLWRRHWQFLKLSDIERRRVLAKDQKQVDWHAETSAGVLREAAWKAGKFTSHIIDLPSNFSKLNSVDGETALITTTRPPQAGETTSFMSKQVKVFSLVHKDTFQTVQSFPRVPGQFPGATNVNGLGHVFSINDHPHQFYYVTEDAYKWLGSPPKATGGKQKWPKLDGFVFIGGQSIASEGSVYLHVDGAHTSSPALSIHEQDTDNLNWVRWGPWKGRCRMMETGYEDFCNHSLTDDCVIITSHDASIIVRQRTGNMCRTLDALNGHCAQYSFDCAHQPAQDTTIEDLVRGIKQFVPTSAVTTARKTQPDAAKVNVLLQSDEYVFCGNVTAIGKHLFCTVGNGLVIFPDFARAFNGRAQRPPLVVDLNGAPISFAHCDHHVVLCTPSAFYILDASQFDDATSPAHLEAVRIDRCGVLASTGYGHRTNNDEKGATARVTVTPGSIYEVLKIDRIWWVEKEKWDGVRDETPVDHFVRIYNFE